MAVSHAEHFVSEVERTRYVKLGEPRSHATYAAVTASIRSSRQRVISPAPPWRRLTTAEIPSAVESVHPPRKHAADTELARLPSMIGVAEDVAVKAAGGSNSGKRQTHQLRRDHRAPPKSHGLSQQQRPPGPVSHAVGSCVLHLSAASPSPNLIPPTRRSL